MCVILFTVALLPVAASSGAKSSLRDKCVLLLPTQEYYDSRDVVVLVKRVVPALYVDTFLLYTETEDPYMTDVFRIYLLSLGQHESGWKKIVSDRKNDNGTVDLGYLMLNELNLKNPEFMALFGPKSTDGHVVIDNIDLYLITCINYFKYLYSRFNCDALYAYNAGESKYVTDRIPTSTYSYKYKIKQINEDFICELYRIHQEIEEAKRTIIAKMEAERFSDKSIRYMANKFDTDTDTTIYNKVSVSELNSTGGLKVAFVELYDTHFEWIIYDPKKAIVERLNFCFSAFCKKNNRDQEIENVFEYVDRLKKKAERRA